MSRLGHLGNLRLLLRSDRPPPVLVLPIKYYPFHFNRSYSFSPSIGHRIAPLESTFSFTIRLSFEMGL
ncbi:hypothetical protein L2E82_51415 [Cichorium intybus]|nr:hypothetical protein L2E82_51415 [Cichorium intybus]